MLINDHDLPLGYDPPAAADPRELTALLIRAEHDRVRTLTTSNATERSEREQLITDALNDMTTHELRGVIRELLSRIPAEPTRRRYTPDPNLIPTERTTA
jgi:hypothetical protein